MRIPKQKIKAEEQTIIDFLDTVYRDESDREKTAKAIHQLMDWGIDDPIQAILDDRDEGEPERELMDLFVCTVYRPAATQTTICVALMFSIESVGIGPHTDLPGVIRVSGLIEKTFQLKRGVSYEIDPCIYSADDPNWRSHRWCRDFIQNKTHKPSVKSEELAVMVVRFNVPTQKTVDETELFLFGKKYLKTELPAILADDLIDEYSKLLSTFFATEVMVTATFIELYAIALNAMLIRREALAIGIIDELKKFPGSGIDCYIHEIEGRQEKFTLWGSVGNQVFLDVALIPDELDTEYTITRFFEYVAEAIEGDFTIHDHLPPSISGEVGH